MLQRGPGKTFDCREALDDISGCIGPSSAVLPSCGALDYTYGEAAIAIRQDHATHSVAHVALPGSCSAQGAVDKVGEPRNVFLALHHHFLCLADAGLRLDGAEGGQPGISEQTVLSAAVSRDPEGERELCARAMAALYHAHAAAIGASRQSSRLCMKISAPRLPVLHAAMPVLESSWCTLFLPLSTHSHL